MGKCVRKSKIYDKILSRGDFMAKNTKEERRELKILIHQAKSIEKTMEQILDKVGKDISFIFLI